MKKQYLLPLAIIIATALFIFIPTSKSSALNGYEFQSGRIMDDGVFFNGSSLDANSIQQFLNSKVPACDTNGSQPYGGTTRATYGASRGYAAPYVCLRNYTENTPTKSAEPGLCNQYNGGSKTSAQIIADVGVACGISQRVILVLLEKEQSLVTDDWPWSIQYRSATGYGCPDTAPCDAEYYGFFNQVYMAARQFKRYARDVNSYSYRPYRTNYIQYNPNAACGGSNVYIQNQATAGLYNYTPYQPNASALANLYGSGDGCGAYGNRNFWRLYNDWFGSVYSNCTYPGSIQNGIYRLYNRGTGNHLLTTNPLEVCYATSIGWLYDGQMFKENTPGGLPVYRLERGGRYLYTNSSAERDSAVTNHGFRYEGVAFFGVDPNITPSEARPVHRLASSNGTYVYTISDFEKSIYLSMGYQYEGIAFYLIENAGTSVSSVYRLSHPTGKYIYTLYDQERDAATQIYGYRYEGIGFNAITQMNQITVPVYRLASNRGYILTTSLLERIYATRIGYRDEGVAMYTYGNMNDPGLKNVYRLSNTSGLYLYTISDTERGVATASYGFRLEGVGFQTAP